MVACSPRVRNCGFETRSGLTKDYNIGMCCFSAKHACIKERESKDWLARNQNNVSELSHMAHHILLFQ
jgi:hypothetical protein